jgi:hypothetical protein
MTFAPGLRVLAVSGLVLTSGCFGGGGGGTSFPQNVSITMTPAVASLAAGSSQQFTATVTNFTTTPAWNIDPTVLVGSNNTFIPGTITQTGLYTAPSAPPAIYYGGAAGPQGVVTINASINYPAPNQLFGATATASETFVITAPTVTAGIYPATQTVALGGTFKFQPYAVGSVYRAYTLQVNGVTGGATATGTITQDNLNAGLYSAPATMPMTGNTVTITVISSADPTKTATAAVTLQ